MPDEIVENLWGELPPQAEITTPLSILRNQAVALQKLTQGVLEGKIITNQTRSGEMMHDLRIAVPALGNYSVEVLTVTHDPLLYPARVTDPEGAFEMANNVEQLRAALKSVLQSERARKLVSALRAQALDARADPAQGMPF